jgi:uncharacterized protein (TIGR02147 family)
LRYTWIVLMSIGQRTDVERPDVFAYLDYRTYLRDYYTFGRSRRSLSYRGLARRAQIRSPSFLKRVMEGERNLQEETAGRVAKACGLAADSSDYFVALVLFNQAQGADQRAAAYRRVQRFARYRKLHALDVARDRYHSDWYLPAIRELVASPHFVEDALWIARALRPRIRPAQAQRALLTLETLGLLKRDESGRLVQADEVVTTGPETANVHMVEYHRTMIGRASAAIQDFPREERDISSLTLCLDAEGLARLKQRLSEVRRELLEEEDLSRGPKSQVVQVNLQLFPLSCRLEEMDDA